MIISINADISEDAEGTFVLEVDKSTVLDALIEALGDAEVYRDYDDDDLDQARHIIDALRFCYANEADINRLKWRLL